MERMPMLGHIQVSTLVMGELQGENLKDKRLGMHHSCLVIRYHIEVAITPDEKFGKSSPLGKETGSGTLRDESGNRRNDR
jgi:hypothetical protein